MIDLTIDEKQIERSAKHCKERGILLPTFAQMRDPSLVPQKIKDDLKTVGLWDIHPRNLFRITWKNEPVKTGGGYSGVNYMELPQELTGVRARIIALVGKWFPTGAHKVGATYGCIAPRLVTGQFEPTKQKAVWPSTGNYCRGGAYVSSLLACESIAILPEEMSQERFEWLKIVAGEIIATPGCESNVKEIFDKCWELKKVRDDIVIFNQFDEFGNHLWHYYVTGSAMEEVLQKELGEHGRFAGLVSNSGSAGTLGCGDYLKEVYPNSKIAVGEALQCPTLLNNGFGGHRIEGIGDKHVPWIHNVRNSDMVIDIDDEHTIRLMRLFNESAGKDFIVKQGVPEDIVANLDLLGISSIANVIGAIKMAKYYELDENDVVITVFTDSMELYNSRMAELKIKKPEYTEVDASRDFGLLQDIGIDWLKELTYSEKKRIHNLKYYTWIEQQNRELSELNAQWYDHDYWNRIHNMVDDIDSVITDFNKRLM
ncbi:pyridoxal-phosphate dependent enzyme [bacterium]|nr:pyridoxal-phosphate dependent enzyme [bacterium]